MEERINANPIEEKNHIDDLTGLHNLTGILDHLQGHGEHAASSKTIIIYINVMNFKTFNQRYGFSGGNDFLRGIADEIRNIFSGELAARTGGDQFIILANSLGIDEIIDKLDLLREAVHSYEKSLNMRLKAGIYQATGNEEDPVIMVDRAKITCDDIMRVYDRDTSFYSEELIKKNELKQYVIDNFENAFKNRYFKVYYQREVRTLTRKTCGYEALSRWMDPKYGIISPAIFVDVLESVHLIHKLDIYIIEQVCSDIRGDIERGLAIEPVSVNLSRLDFELCDIMTEIDKCRAKYDIPVNLLHIEVTESALTSGSDFLGEQIKKFREAGYEVWMDDFGAGYSSFNNLKSYDFDVVKIDMNFLRDFDTNKKTRVILAGIVNMAKELGIHTLAEGVETEDQYDFLRRIGCEKLQGYLFGKPKPISNFNFEVDCSFDTCEDHDYSEYYNMIGNINFMSSIPLRDKQMEVFNNLPIAIVELTGENNLSIIYANNAYMNFFSSLGISSVKEVAAKLALSELPEVKGLIDLLKKAEKSYTKRSEQDFIANGSVINSKVRFISRTGDKAAFAMVSRNVTLYSEGKMADNIHVAMAHVFNQYFRVDLFDEDGTVENIFLNGDQVAVADVECDSVKAAQIYSNMYLYEQDKERFRKFYDIPSVRKRLAGTNSDYLVDYYHSAIPGDEGRMQMYMILPFYYNGRWKYISCCRYADEISDDLINN